MGLVVKVGEGSVTGNGGSSTDRETRGCQINGSSGTDCWSIDREKIDGGRKLDW